jgi:hypothetical protein
MAQKCRRRRRRRRRRGKVMVKVKLSLCLTKHDATKTYWRRGGIAPRILDLSTR